MPTVNTVMTPPAGTGFDREEPQEISGMSQGQNGILPDSTREADSQGSQITAEIGGHDTRIFAPATEYLVTAIAAGHDTPVVTKPRGSRPKAAQKDSTPMALASSDGLPVIAEAGVPQFPGSREFVAAVFISPRVPEIRRLEPTLQEVRMPAAVLPDAAMPKPELPKAPPQEIAALEVAPVVTPKDLPQDPALAAPKTATNQAEQSGNAAEQTDSQTETKNPEVAQIEAEDQNPDTIRPIGIEAGNIGNLAPNVRTNRLAGIGRGDETPQETTPQTAPNEGDTLASNNALLANSEAFENPENKPVLSIVLLDDPEQPLTDAALSHLPFALSFAIDATRADAADAAARYRAAGFEVLLLAAMPPLAKDKDVEVAFEAYTTNVPTAVAVLDAGNGQYLRGSNLAQRISGILADSGHGLVTLAKGLNSAQSIAAREGVQAATVFRLLDGRGENPGAISRHLDRAAFQATQDGQVIVLGHTRDETTEALVFWALSRKAQSVAIAPVSAVLKAQ